MITQDCNLKCRYCYGGESGRYNGSGQRMTKKTIEASIDFLVKNCTNAVNYSVAFFGGEPFMEMDLIKHGINYCKSIDPTKFKFNSTTNSTLFSNEILDFVEIENIKIMISLDGYKEVHDFSRKYRNGKGSFDKVMKSIKLMQHRFSSDHFRIRATIPNEFYHKYNEIVNFFLENGIKHINIASESTYFDDIFEFTEDVNQLKMNQKNISNYTKKVKQGILNGENPPFVPFLLLLSRLHNATDNYISCGIFKGTTAVSANGDLFPCHRFVGMKGFCFGNVYEGIDNQAFKRIADSLDFATTEKCNNCFAKYICKRSCVRQIAKNGGNFVSYSEEFCDVMRELVEEYIVFYYKLKINRPDYFDKIGSLQAIFV